MEDKNLNTFKKARQLGFVEFKLTMSGLIDSGQDTTPKFLVRLAGQDEQFRPDLEGNNLEQLRRYCALQVATNPNVQKGQVVDVGDEVLYECDVESAKRDLEEWGYKA